MHHTLIVAIFIFLSLSCSTIESETKGIHGSGSFVELTLNRANAKRFYEALLKFNIKPKCFNHGDNCNIDVESIICVDGLKRSKTVPDEQGKGKLESSCYSLKDGFVKWRESVQSAQLFKEVVQIYSKIGAKGYEFTPEKKQYKVANIEAQKRGSFYRVELLLKTASKLITYDDE